LQALVRWDPAGFAQREIAERQEAHLPPASRVATLTGPADLLEVALASLDLPTGAEVLGPVPVEDEERYVIRVPRTAGAQLSAALVLMQSQRSARKEPHLKVDVDPVTLG
jgi:primosomal protein N' (replication factor Y)